MAADMLPYGRKTQRPPAVKEVHVLWITAGLSCDGDSVSITAATQPSIEDVFSALFPASPRFICITRCWPTKSATTS